MNYETFLERRRRWDRLEEQLDGLDRALGRRRAADVGHEALESVVLDYCKTVNDYALARSRFPDTWAARHLAALVARGNHRLRAEAGGRRRGVGHFYAATMPRLFRRMSADLYVIVVLFLVAVLLGLALGSTSTDAGRVFLGEESIEALARGEIWTDRIRDQSSFASAAIARNNMKVAMTAWAGGLLAGVGSLFIVFFNGLMLGVVVVTTAHFGMQGSLLEFISAHGPLELTLILVAGAAGLHMGRAMISDGDRPRGERLAEAARTSVLVLLGCLPFFLTLGFVEGFLSPAEGLSARTKLAVGLALEVLFLATVLRPVRETPPEPLLRETTEVAA